MTTQFPSEISLPLKKCNFFRPQLEQVMISSVMIDLELLAYPMLSCYHLSDKILYYKRYVSLLDINKIKTP